MRRLLDRKGDVITTLYKPYAGYKKYPVIYLVYNVYIWFTSWLKVVFYWMDEWMGVYHVALIFPEKYDTLIFTLQCAIFQWILWVLHRTQSWIGMWFEYEWLSETLKNSEIPFKTYRIIENKNKSSNLNWGKNSSK